MTEAEFRDRWRTERPIYAAWGDFVRQKICERVGEVVAPVSLDYFLKVPVKPRLKEEATLVDKAFHRKMPYTDPYGDITDKIGMRFVVLLTTDITTICNALEELGTFWTHSKDRDYETERLEKPLEFSYQSMHYVVRANSNVQHNGIIIPAGTPCQIQVRTLLQHAHSELTHDTLYKPKTTAQPAVKRKIAKSMALIEATDEFFTQAMAQLKHATAPQTDLLTALGQLYTSEIGIDPEVERSNQLVIDTFADRLPDNPSTTIADYLKNNSFVFNKIKERRTDNHFYRQPLSMLAYYLVHAMPSQTKDLWPLEVTDLAQVFSDLGKKFEH